MPISSQHLRLAEHDMREIYVVFIPKVKENRLNPLFPPITLTGYKDIPDRESPADSVNGSPVSSIFRFNPYDIVFVDKEDLSRPVSVFCIE
jgi:hypothetical protein